MFCKFLDFSGEFAGTPKLHRHNSTGDVDCSENALLFCSQEPREQRQSGDLNRAFSAGIFGFHQSWGDAPGLVVNCAFGANSQGTATSRLGESGEDTAHYSLEAPR